MQEFLILLGSFSAVFVIGVYSSKLYLFVRTKLKRELYQPVDNAKVRMKSKNSFYRTRLISHTSSEWVFAAPMQRDSFVPVPIGEEVDCEVVAHGGVLLFTTQVIRRSSEEGTIVVAAPKNVKLENRRDGQRRTGLPMEVVVGGKDGSVMDLSPGGARVRIQGFEKEGNMVRIDLPSGESRGATVVDSKNDHTGSVLRLRFDEPIEVANE